MAKTFFFHYSRYAEYYYCCIFTFSSCVQVVLTNLVHGHSSQIEIGKTGRDKGFTIEHFRFKAVADKILAEPKSSLIYFFYFSYVVISVRLAIVSTVCGFKTRSSSVIKCKNCVKFVCCAATFN